MNPTICIFGFGYTAVFLAKELAALGYNIVGTSRDPKIRAQYKSKGYIVDDFNISAVDALLQHATHLFITIPPQITSVEPVLANFRSLLEKYRQQFQWIGYASSTSVYGDHQGDWVDESSPPKNLSAR